ncbi:MAG: FCD domain-containing protein [Pseudomonadota bacterium]|nr:FCD domain-containing protein [Pseudomonadota bacterium]
MLRLRLQVMQMNRSIALHSQERMQLVQAEHYAIYDAMERMDADGARRAMRLHIDNARRRVFEGG